MMISKLIRHSCGHEEAHGVDSAYAEWLLTQLEVRECSACAQLERCALCGADGPRREMRQLTLRFTSEGPDRRFSVGERGLGFWICAGHEYVLQDRFQQLVAAMQQELKR